MSSNAMLKYVPSHKTGKLSVATNMRLQAHSQDFEMGALFLLLRACAPPACFELGVDGDV